MLSDDSSSDRSDSSHSLDTKHSPSWHALLQLPTPLADTVRLISTEWLDRYQSLLQTNSGSRKAEISDSGRHSGSFAHSRKNPCIDCELFFEPRRNVRLV